MAGSINWLAEKVFGQLMRNDVKAMSGHQFPRQLVDREQAYQGIAYDEYSNGIQGDAHQGRYFFWQDVEVEVVAHLHKHEVTEVDAEGH